MNILKFFEEYSLRISFLSDTYSFINLRGSRFKFLYFFSNSNFLRMTSANDFKFTYYLVYGIGYVYNFEI